MKPAGKGRARETLNTCLFDFNNNLTVSLKAGSEFLWVDVLWLRTRNRKSGLPIKLENLNKEGQFRFCPGYSFVNCVL